MNPDSAAFTRLRQITAASLLAWLATACSVVGPTAISSGRLAYNDAITETDNQQMLNVLVRKRYGERGHLLTVASVTANVSVTTSAGVQAGFGNTSNYRGNLVPFTGGVVYEENPTISYIPVTGEKYLRQLTSPISLALLTQISRTVTDPTPPLLALVSEINGLYNPDFKLTPEDDDPRFDKVIGLIAELTRAHRLHWVQDSDRKEEFSLVIDQSQPRHAALVKELLIDLGLPPARYTAARVVIPVSLALNASEVGGIGITTRSVWDLVEILSAGIEVPAGDLEKGVATAAPPPGRVGRLLRVAYSRDKPDHAYIAIEYRDGWFYIDDRDMTTKAYFNLLGGLWSMTMANAAGGVAAPVLTVPVSR